MRGRFCFDGFEVNDGFGVAPVGDCKTFELVGGLSEHAHRWINGNDCCVREPGINGGGEDAGADRDIEENSVEVSEQI